MLLRLHGNKDETVGVSALFASEQFDCGDIIGQSSSLVAYPITLQEAIDVVCKCYTTLVKDIVAKILNNEEIVGKSQGEEEATYSLWRDKEDYRIDWSKDSDYIENFVNALGFPYNGASSLMNGRLVRVLGVEQIDDIEVENRDRNIGKVIFKQDGKPVVVCGSGLIKIDQLIENDTKESVFPLRRFRTRFK
jgi:methionyl-tRNA formyltransferase